MRKADIIVLNGKAHTLGEWCEKLGMSVDGVKGRFRRGWSVKDALTTPPTYVTGEKLPEQPRPDRNCKTCTMSMQVWLDDMGVYYACDYLGRVGKRRPCEYGDGCTVKLKKKRGKTSEGKS